MHALTRSTADLERMGSWSRQTRRSRRLCALFSQALARGAALPRFFGSCLVGVFFVLVLSFAIITGGHGEQTFKMITSSLGLAVSDIHITGIDQTSEIDVLAAIGLDGDSAMLAFDVNQAHEHIVALPWVQSASLRKDYPSRLHVAIVERKPLAVWQHRGRLDIIDEGGEVIVPFSGGQRTYSGRNLPLLVGRGANHHGLQILALVEKFENFQSKIRAYRRVGNRRWDIVLDNGVEIRLPERGAEGRLSQMLALDAAQQLLSRDVLSIDLRVADRMSVALSDEALARWHEHEKKAIAARKKAKQQQGGRG